MADAGESWSCAACTLQNDVTAEVCDACGATSPLVLESYACEEQAQLARGEAPRPRGGSQGSAMASIPSDADPWAQAECEWAHVEAHQEQSRRRK